MDDKIIQEWCMEQFSTPELIEIPEEFFKTLTKEQAEQIVLTLGGRKLIKLPQREIDFFEWVKVNDNDVWEDLWNDGLYEPYIVSINILPYLIDEHENGFPICDLENVTNYFFSLSFMQDEESNVIIEAARNRLLDKQELSTAHRLALEVSLAPIDIWHFAYKYKITLDEAKSAVKELVDDYALVHLKDAEHIAMAMQI